MGMYVPSTYYQDRILDSLYVDEFRHLLGVAIQCRKMRQEDIEAGVLAALGRISGGEE